MNYVNSIHEKLGDVTYRNSYIMQIKYFLFCFITQNLKWPGLFRDMLQWSSYQLINTKSVNDPGSLII